MVLVFGVAGFGFVGVVVRLVLGCCWVLSFVVCIGVLYLLVRLCACHRFALFVIGTIVMVWCYTGDSRGLTLIHLVFACLVGSLCDLSLVSLLSFYYFLFSWIITFIIVWVVDGLFSGGLCCFVECDF